MISLAAALDLIPEADYAEVIDNLVGDVALMIAQARTPPSYIYMVEQGATTLWETWTGTQYVPAASRNHIMFGSNSDWYYKFLAGITMAGSSRGWQQLVLKPEVW